MVFLLPGSSEAQDASRCVELRIKGKGGRKDPASFPNCVWEGGVRSHSI